LVNLFFLLSESFCSLDFFRLIFSVFSKGFFRVCEKKKKRTLFGGTHKLAGWDWELEAWEQNWGEITFFKKKFFNFFFFHFSLLFFLDYFVVLSFVLSCDLEKRELVWNAFFFRDLLGGAKGRPKWKLFLWIARPVLMDRRNNDWGVVSKGLGGGGGDELIRDFFLKPVLIIHAFFCFGIIKMLLVSE